MSDRRHGCRCAVKPWMAKNGRRMDVGVSPVTGRLFPTRPKYLHPCKQAEDDVRSHGWPRTAATRMSVCPPIRHPRDIGDPVQQVKKKLDSQYRSDDLGMTPTWMSVCPGHMDVNERPPHGSWCVHLFVIPETSGIQCKR